VLKDNFVLTWAVARIPIVSHLIDDDIGRLWRWSCGEINLRIGAFAVLLIDESMSHFFSFSKEIF
jgi:hypothetical protein